MKKNNFWLNLQQKLTKIPALVILIVVVLTVFFGYYMATHTKIDNDTETFLPDNNPAKIYNNKSKEIFGDTSVISVIVSFPKGLYTETALKKLQTITAKFEKIDARINLKIISKYLKGFSDAQKSKIMSMLNEKLLELKSSTDLVKIFGDADTLSEYFDDEKTIAKIKQVSKKDIDSIYTSLTRYTDKLKKWKKRLRDVKSLTNVDYTFSTFTDTKKLEEFFKSKTMDEQKNKVLAGYFTEKSLMDLNRLKTFIQSESFKKAATIYKVSDSDLTKYKSFSDNELNTLISIIKSTPKQISVSDLVDFSKVNQNPSLELFLIHERLRTFEMYEKMLYSPTDNTATGISLEMVPQLTIEDQEVLISTIKEIIKEESRDKEIVVHMSGKPVINNSMGKNMNRDLGMLFPIVIAVIILFLYFSFRHFQGVFLPIITVVLTTIWTLGTIALLGYPIALVSTIIPVLMVAVGSAYGIHVIHHYYEDRIAGLSREEALSETSRKVGGAVVMAGLTTIAGFASLATSSISPIKQFGVFTAVGILYALLVSLIFIPALLKVFKLPKRVLKHSEADEVKASILNRLLKKIGNFSIKRGTLLLVSLLILIAITIVGTFSLKVEMNLIDQFKSNTTIRIDNNYAKDHFAGTDVINVVFDTGKKNGVLDYEFLQKLDQLKKSLKGTKHVGKIITIADQVKQMHKTMNYGSLDFYRVPEKVFDVNGNEEKNLSGSEKKTALSKVILSYIDMFNFDDIRTYLDANKRMTRFSIILDTGSTISTGKIGTKVRAKIAEIFPKDVNAHLTGANQVVIEANNLLIKGQISSLITSIIMVVILVTIMYRSLILGLVSIIPLSLAILINFCLMGVFGIHLDAATAVIANMAIGIGVDYTIHYFSGYLHGLKEGLSKNESTLSTTVRTGNAVLVNAFSVACGFAVLCFSSFIPLIHTGWLIALTMLTTSFAALTFIPAILNKLKRFAIIKKFSDSYTTKVTE